METFIIRKKPNQNSQEVTGFMIALRNMFPTIKVEPAIVIETDLDEIAGVIRLMGGKALPQDEAASATAVVE